MVEYGLSLIEERPDKVNEIKNYLSPQNIIVIRMQNSDTLVSSF